MPIDCHSKGMYHQTKTKEEVMLIRHEPLVYLAGPMTGLSLSESVEWRKYSAVILYDRYSISSLIPTRWVELGVDGQMVLNATYPEIPGCTSSAIFKTDFYDVKRSDALLVNFMTETKKPSIGTIAEIGWAYALGKPIVIAMGPNEFNRHPMIVEAATVIVDSLDKAIDSVGRILDRGY